MIINRRPLPDCPNECDRNVTILHPDADEDRDIIVVCEGCGLSLEISAWVRAASKDKP